MKRKTILLHGAWFAAGAAAFAVGFSVGGSRPDSQARSDGNTTVVRKVVDANPGVHRPGADTASGRAASEEALGRTVGAGRRALSALEIEDLAHEAFTDASQLKRSLAFSKLIESLTPENALLIKEAMEEMGAGRDEWELFRYAWGAADGEAAIEFASTLEDGRDRARFLDEAVAGWASNDPRAAMAYVENYEGDEDALERLRHNLVGGLADHDIGMATDYALRRAAAGDPEAADYLERVAGEQLRTAGVQGAIAWSAHLPNGTLKGAAYDEIASRYVREDPEAAAAWAGQYASEDYAWRAIEEVGDEWAERDPAAAVSWLENLPEGRGKEEGMQSALNEWTERDARGASEYLAAMPDSPTKDHAIDGFARRLSYEDPLSAVAWAETIRNEEMRVEALTRAGQQWMRRDADAALEWLGSTNLPPEAQQAVLEPPRRGRDGRWRG